MLHWLMLLRSKSVRYTYPLRYFGAALVSSQLRFPLR